MRASATTQKAATVFYAEQGRVAKRLMTDNAFAYVHKRSLRDHQGVVHDGKLRL